MRFKVQLELDVAVDKDAFDDTKEQGPVTEQLEDVFVGATGTDIELELDELLDQYLPFKPPSGPLVTITKVEVTRRRSRASA